MQQTSVNSYNDPTARTWGRAWMTDPADGRLGPDWYGLVQQFQARAPIGALAPPVSCLRLDGGPFEMDRTQPWMLLLFGSFSCPPCVTTVRTVTPSLADLHARFGAVVRFVFVYTRESHPGPGMREHRSFDEKLERARAFAAELDVPFEVVVDDLEGSTHQGFVDPQFNSPAFILDADDKVVYKSAWTDPAALEEVLADLPGVDTAAEPDMTSDHRSEWIYLVRSQLDPHNRSGIDDVIARIGRPVERPMGRSKP